MRDAFGRQIDYIRLSVTDRCNLRCTYCMAEDMQFLPRRDLLTFEEIEALARHLVARGVRRIRLTGGEPLVRKGIMDLVGRLARPRSATRPLPHDAVLLADAGLILEPQLHLGARRQVAKMRLQRARPVFLKASTTRASCAGCCGRALMWLKPSLRSSLPTAIPILKASPLEFINNRSKMRSARGPRETNYSLSRL